MTTEAQALVDWFESRLAAKKHNQARGLEGAVLGDDRELAKRVPDLLALVMASPPTSAWRDIASAPKDGGDILLWAPDYSDTPIIGRWSEGAGAWDSEVATMNEGPSTGGDPEECDGPTHWMPLPLPPGEEK